MAGANPPGGRGPTAAPARVPRDTRRGFPRGAARMAGGPGLAPGSGMRRLLAIGFVWLCCAGAWAILGSTLAFRSGSVTGSLGAEVRALWGPPLVQNPPSAVGRERHKVR